MDLYVSAMTGSATLMMDKFVEAMGLVTVENVNVKLDGLEKLVSTQLCVT